MADRTLDARPNGAPPAETPAAAPAAAKSSALMTWLPLIITVIAMPALAYATTRFVLVPQMKRALAPAGAHSSASSETKKDSESGVAETNTKVLVPLSKILVNVAGTMGTRYLMTSVTLVGGDDNFRGKIEENKDQLVDLANGALCTKTISDLEKPGSRNVIRTELMTVFNNALGGPLIKEIYITELAIQ
jgi:flagellar FliL protein